MEDPAVPYCIPPPPSDKSHKWYFSHRQLSRTPSIVKNGFDAKKELRYRQQSASFIQEMGEKLNHNVKDARARISQLGLCTAMVYMHRFYAFHSFAVFDPRDMGAACLFLAAKVEECPRKLEHIVKVWHILKFPNSPQLDVKSEGYHSAAQLIMTYENIILQTIAFDLEVQTPHVFVIKNCQMIMRGNRDLAEAAYWFASDILHLTNFCIRYRPSVVACVCIHLACSWANWEIPASAEGRRWYQYRDDEVTRELLQGISKEFVEILKDTKGSLKVRGHSILMKKHPQNNPAPLPNIPQGSNTPTPSTSSEPSHQSQSEPHHQNHVGSSSTFNPKAGPPGSHQQAAPSGSATNPTPSTSSGTGNHSEVQAQGGMKRVKTEPTVLDLNRYKERSRVTAEQAQHGGGGGSGVKRESFLPDMSERVIKTITNKDQNRTKQGSPEKREHRKKEPRDKELEKSLGNGPERVDREQYQKERVPNPKRPLPEGGHPPHDHPSKHRRTDEHRTGPPGKNAAPPGSALTPQQQHQKNKERYKEERREKKYANQQLQAAATGSSSSHSQPPSSSIQPGQSSSSHRQRHPGGEVPPSSSSSSSSQQRADQKERERVELMKKQHRDREREKYYQHHNSTSNPPQSTNKPVSSHHPLLEGEQQRSKKHHNNPDHTRTSAAQISEKLSSGGSSGKADAHLKNMRDAFNRHHQSQTAASQGKNSSPRPNGLITNSGKPLQSSNPPPPPKPPQFTHQALPPLQPTPFLRHCCVFYVIILCFTCIFLIFCHR